MGMPGAHLCRGSQGIPLCAGDALPGGEEEFRPLPTARAAGWIPARGAGSGELGFPP